MERKEKIENFVNEIFSNEKVPEGDGNDLFDGKAFWIKNAKRLCTFILTYICKYEPDNLNMDKFRECLGFDFFKSETIKAKISQDEELKEGLSAIACKATSVNSAILAHAVTCILLGLSDLSNKAKKSEEELFSSVMAEIVK